MTPSPSDCEDRVLVMMPSTKDAVRTTELLRRDKVSSLVCADLAMLCRELRAGAGALLLTDAAILGEGAGHLAESLRAQPSWSALPIIVVAHEMATQHVQRGASPVMEGIIVVERPVRMHSLLTVVHSALRSRRHQYQIRDDIALREQQAMALRTQEERLRFAMTAGRLGSWSLDLTTMILETSSLCKSNFGRAHDDCFTYADLCASVHPADQQRMWRAMHASIETGVDYDVECRAVWPNGEEHWVMMRGRATRDGTARYMAGISQDIDDSKRMHDALLQSEAELAQQAVQLRDTDRRKDEFLATLAHELRNPLAPIRTGVDVLRSGRAPAAAGRLLGIMDRQITHMVRLIDDLLDVSRITRGVLELRKATTTLGGVLDAAVEASRTHVAARGHELSVTVREPELGMYWDGTRIAQAVSNLLINASKYTAPGGHVSLAANRDGATMRIEVSDDGIGIAADQLENVFDMFSQMDPKLEGAQGGLGIGLALVRTVASLHGGCVHARSAGRAQGSTFVLELPIGIETRETQSPLPIVAEACTSARRVLVVDDNDDAAEILSLMLSTRGYETAIAHDAASALEAAASNPPDVVILDIGLPDATGYDVARTLRAQPRASALGIIALTGWGTQEDKNRAREAGFDAHLTKPVDESSLHSALNHVEALLGKSPAS